MAWAAARLHFGVRDAINRHQGVASNKPFEGTLGSAIAELERLATRQGRSDQVSWVQVAGRPAARRRNAVIHAITYAAPDGKQALKTVDDSAPGRFLAPDLRAVSLALIQASTDLPA